jgi:1-aminocyclopropane-1-carboxylate deaminase/D-cysteine desulfhydrase-like pyridoxal-dependent ACC family enzyme
MPRLGAHLGFEDGALWVKRDDLTGLGAGGNKARKLEYLVADALARGCDTLLTGGAAQSNHVRTTGAAAGVAGLSCVAILGGEPGAPEGNLLLDALFAVELVWAGTYDAERIETTMAETCLRLAAEGRRPYEVPLGGASDVGTLGYVAAAAEVMTQAPMGAVVYTATGSGGTQAGLAVGLGHHDRVRGVDVGAIPDVAERIEALVASTASLACRPFPVGHLSLDRSQVGAGYGDRTDAAREALQLAARLEGLVLDPVYSAKAMAALIADRRSGRLRADHPVVFLHTGGSPVLFTDRYQEWAAG